MEPITVKASIRSDRGKGAARRMRRAEQIPAVAYGKDLLQAYFRMETVEHFARINLVAEMLGGARPLPRAEVDKLFDSRTRYGVRSKATPTAGCPTAAEDLEPGAPRSSEDGFWVTRRQLVDLVEQAVLAREEKR